MTCTRPIQAYRGEGGRICFSSSGASGGWSDRPLQFACGQCTDCRLNRAKEWAIRCYHEMQMHEKNCFITLTYDDEHLPKDRSLDKSHWQKFAKRLRKKSAFRYFHCGEYGRKEKTERPHYHAILFGTDFQEDQVLLETTKWGNLYTSEKLSKAWQHQGFVTVGSATWQSAGYVARYLMKKVTGKEAEKHYQGRTPEYVTMSRGGRNKDGFGGIGKSWFDKYHEDVYPHDEVVINGKQMRPPKYYDSLISEQDRANYRAQRRQKAAKRDTTPERLRAHEQITEARQKLRKRKL